MTPRRFRWFIIAAVTATAMVSAIAAVQLARGRDILTRNFGWVERAQGNGRYVASVGAATPADGLLLPGDRLLAWNGDTAIARAGTVFERYAASPGERVTLLVDRGGRETTVSLVVAHRALPLRDWIAFIANIVVWLGTALFIGLSRPESRLPRLAATAALVMTYLRLILRFVPIGVISPVHVVVGFHFFSLLSAPRGLMPRWNHIWLGVLYVVAIATAIIRQPLNVAFLASGPRVATEFSARHATLFSWNDLALSMVYFVAALGIVVVTLWNYRRVTDPGQRRRIRWVVWGSMLGVAPAIAWGSLRVLGLEVAGAGATVMQANQRLVYWLNIAFLLVPITVAYAVVRHQLFDIRVIIRMGVKYLLAKRALQVLLALPVMSIVVTFVRHRDRTIGDVLTDSMVAVIAAVTAVIAISVREPLLRWIDQRFFQDKQDVDLVLQRLIDSLDQSRSEAQAATLVARGISEALHPKALFVWTRAARDMVLSFSSAAHEAAVPIAADSPLLARLEQVGTPVTPQMVLVQQPADSEAEWLRRAEVQMLVPVMGKDGCAVALLALGEKRSEEPYGAYDRRLLEAVGKRLGLVWENLSLERRVGEHQRIERDVLNAIDPSRRGLLKECPRCGRCYDFEVAACDDDREPLTLTVPVPRTLNSRYELQQLLGRGGMGAVYAARDLQLGRDVAVKVAFGTVNDGRRFQREARAAAQLNHPNVIRVYDFGHVSGSGEGIFLVMERVRGHTLRAELNQRGTLDGHSAAEWLDQILAGLAGAHAAHIIHRDLKPENVIGAHDAEHGLAVKILDFGIAKVLDVSSMQSQLTHTGVVLGTLGYMSPEQLTGAGVDDRADVFSLGVMTAEMLTGQRPFAGTSYPELLRAVLLDEYHLSGDSVAMREIDAILQRCLAKEPAARPSAVALRASLIPCLRALSGGVNLHGGPGA